MSVDAYHINVRSFDMVPFNMAIKCFKGVQRKSIVNRPGVAGAVLQTPWSLIHSFIHLLIDSVILLLQIFKISLITNRNSQEAEILRNSSTLASFYRLWNQKCSYRSIVFARKEMLLDVKGPKTQSKIPQNQTAR